MPVSRSRVVAVAGVTLCAFRACAVYDAGLLESAPAPDADAAADARRDAPNDDGGDGCAHRLPPPRPTHASANAGTLEFVAAIQKVDMGSAESAKLGYDLDKTCTCPGPDSCKPAAGANSRCDLPGGADNAGGALFSLLSQLGGSTFNLNDVSKTFTTGSGSMLIGVRGYNGEFDDDRVELSVFVSLGISPLPDDGGAFVPPKHDGNDTWSVDVQSVVGGAAATPPYASTNVDANAYVSGGELVGTVDFPFVLAGNAAGLALNLKGSVVTAKLAASNGSYALTDGIVAGRWATRTLLTSMQYLRDPLATSRSLCGTDPTYLAIKDQICKSTDLASDVAGDNTNAPCAAISVAVGFDAEPAKIGALTTGKSQGAPCGPTYTDDCQ